MAKRIYIAGPMTGLPDHNYPAFHAAASRMRDLGYEVENPAENLPPPCGSWEGYMRLAIGQLITCDSIFMLKGWKLSRGAPLEHRIAYDLGMEILEEDEDD